MGTAQGCGEQHRNRDSRSVADDVPREKVHGEERGEHAKVRAHRRITSYNVCYTKLLRIACPPVLTRVAGTAGGGVFARAAGFPVRGTGPIARSFSRNNFV